MTERHPGINRTKLPNTVGKAGLLAARPRAFLTRHVAGGEQKGGKVNRHHV
jgi:hypothetical protein